MAAPSAASLACVAFCLLDATAQAQTSRLRARGDPQSLLVHHHAFADWMRQQASNPMHMLEVVTAGGWDGMRWDRIPGLTRQWVVHMIDTTDLSPATVADDATSWISGVLAGTAPAIRPTFT